MFVESRWHLPYSPSHQGTLITHTNNINAPRLELELHGGYPKKLYVCPFTPERFLSRPHHTVGTSTDYFLIHRQRYSPNSTFSIHPIRNLFSSLQFPYSQRTILGAGHDYLFVCCVYDAKTEPICPWNLLRDFIDFVSFVKTAGSKDIFIREHFGRLTQNRVSSSSANLIAHLPRNVSIIRCWRHAFGQA